MSNTQPLPGAETVGGRIEIHDAGDWAALYLDGVLVEDSVGDSYIAEEMAMTLCGVTTVQDPAFMRGQSQRDGVAPTLEAVTEYRDKRDNLDARLAEADAKRAQAFALLEEAIALDPRGSTTPTVRRKKTAHFIRIGGRHDVQLRIIWRWEGLGLKTWPPSHTGRQKRAVHFGCGYLSWVIRWS
jgi:hypothetical protein